MNELYLEEAIDQLEKAKKDINNIYDLMVKSLGKDKRWCPHCLLEVWGNGKCPRCGTKTTDIPEE